MGKAKALLHSIAKRLTMILLICLLLILFVMSPFYARAILWGLNKIPVTVNQIAAASQQGDGLLEDEDQPEPGSPLWVLQQQLLLDPPEQIYINQIAVDSSNVLFGWEHTHNSKTDIVSLQQIKQGYEDFLQQPIAITKPSDKNSIDKSKAHVIIVVGGGLAKDKNKNIFVNPYTELRLYKAIEQEKNNSLPILLSGVEAPYMQAWLKKHQIEARLLENKSMNTCENTRFTSLLLQKKGGAPLVELITDAYHMPRTQRLFAMNGIDTIPVIAPLPNQLTDWQPAQQNLMHSRRATYEAIASVRDLWFGETNCREVP